MYRPWAYNLGNFSHMVVLGSTHAFFACNNSDQCGIIKICKKCSSLKEIIIAFTFDGIDNPDLSDHC